MTEIIHNTDWISLTAGTSVFSALIFLVLFFMLVDDASGLIGTILSWIALIDLAVFILSTISLFVLKIVEWIWG